MKFILLMTFETLAVIFSPNTDNCYYTLDLSDVNCDKKEVRKFKRSKLDESTGFIKITYYVNEARIVENTKGVGSSKFQTFSKIQSSMKMELRDGLKECDTLFTFVKFDLKSNQIFYVKDYESFNRVTHLNLIT